MRWHLTLDFLSNALLAATCAYWLTQGSPWWMVQAVALIYRLCSAVARDTARNVAFDIAKRDER